MSNQEGRLHLDAPLRVSEALSVGTGNFKENASTLIGGAGAVVVVWAIITFVSAMIDHFLLLALSPQGRNGLIEETAIQSLLKGPLVYILSGLLWFPLYRGALRSLDGFAPKFGEFFEPPSRLLYYGLSALAARFLQMLPDTILAFPMVIVQATVQGTAAHPPLGPLYAALTPYFLILGLFTFGLIPFFTMFGFFTVDNAGRGIGANLKLSFRTGWRHYLPLLGLSFICFTTAALGILACGAGVVITIPWALCMWGAGYRQLVDPAAVGRHFRRDQAWARQDEQQEDAFRDDGSWDEGDRPN